MISFIENKVPCLEKAREYLKISESRNQWTNFGPTSRILEEAVEVMIMRADKCVVATSSGTTALFALIELHNLLNGRPLRWVVSSFGFYCSKQGPLRNATVVDCDASGMIDLNLIPECDGIVVTNIFGGINDLSCYEDYCNERDIILIVDAATALCAAPWVGDGIISFHQTKPWGIGEGGCIVVDQPHEELARRIINFGIGLNEPSIGFNGKMSDITASFILPRLLDLKDYGENYKTQWTRITTIAINCGFHVLPGSTPKIPSCAALLSPTKCTTDNDLITLRKYYKPLQNTPVATQIYDQIINFPCHQNVTLTDNQIYEVLISIIGSDL